MMLRNAPELPHGCVSRVSKAGKQNLLLHHSRKSSLKLLWQPYHYCCCFLGRLNSENYVKTKKPPRDEVALLLVKYFFDYKTSPVIS